MNIKSYTIPVIIMLLSTITIAYIDIPINIARKRDMVSYTFPIEIDTLDYELVISYGGNNQQEYIIAPRSKLNRLQKTINIKKQGNSIQHGYIVGKIRATSIEGYSFEGWIRFILSIVLYIEERYYHQFNLNLNRIKSVNHQNYVDGIIKFGPDLKNNKIYAQLKKNTKYINQDYVALYRGHKDQHSRIQLGGYEKNFATLHQNGNLFQNVGILVHNDKWVVQVQSISLLQSPTEQFHLSSSRVNLSLNIQSPYLTLPKLLSSEILRSIQTEHIQCNSKNYQIQNHQDKLEYSILFCQNFTLSKLGNDIIKFSLDPLTHLNVSLRHLLRDYTKNKTASFYIRFSDDPSEWTFGQSIFQSNYIVLDMENRKMLFSQLKQEPEPGYLIYIMRVLVHLFVLSILARYGMSIWRKLTDPNRRRRVWNGQQSIRLFSNHETNSIQD